MYKNNYNMSHILHPYYGGLIGGAYGISLSYITIRHNYKIDNKNSSIKNIFKEMIFIRSNRKITSILCVSGALLGYFVVA